VRLLFVMRHSGYVRNFESTIRLLCERGHEVHVGFHGRTKYAQLDPGGIADQLESELPGFTYGDAPLRRDGWGLLGRDLRLGLDYLRFLEPAYDAAPKLRERAAVTAPPDILAKTKDGLARTGPGRRLLAARLRAMNAAIATDPVLDGYLRDTRPDVLAITPLVEPGSPQAEYVRSAHALGIRTAYCVASWDNLTNKGLVHGPVDLVTVWNETMKREAIDMHRVPASRIAVTGAAAFDHWFSWRPSVTRDEFCARVGLPAGRPYVLYVCSSKFVAPKEVPFVRTWLTRLREAGSPLRDVGVLVRPHPQNTEQWHDVDLGGLGPVALWPCGGAAPVDTQTRSDYFDSMHFSGAVVGVNTTAEIECAIVGRPVHALRAPEFQGTQEGTLHFRYLRDVAGGVVQMADDAAAHVQQLAASLKDPSAGERRARAFVDAFVRPFGRETPATPRVVDALEQLAARPAVAGRPPFWAASVRKRLEPRAAELARVAAEEPQKKIRIHRGTSAKDVRTKQEWGERQQRIAATADAFHRMGDFDRRSVIERILADIPATSFVELIAANKPQRLDYPHAEIYLQVTSKTEVFRVKACAKEPFTIEWIHSRIAANDVLYDVGANVGAYSLVAARKPGGGARVYSFEAGYANLAALTANVALNGLGGQVMPMPVALSDRTGTDVFNLRDLEPGGARHALGADTLPEAGATLFPQPVLVFRLDDLIAQFQLPEPNHIKLDVDGGELAVLAGAARTLASPALRTVLIEVSTSLSDAVTEALGRSGLHLEAKILKKNKAGEYAVWYGVFGRGDAAATVVTTEHHQ
jgi:FkbM family methyltransferase